VATRTAGLLVTWPMPQPAAGQASILSPRQLCPALSQFRWLRCCGSGI
jgi:hypothetical protein